MSAHRGSAHRALLPEMVRNSVARIKVSMALISCAIERASMPFSVHCLALDTQLPLNVTLCGVWIEHRGILRLPKNH
jgi:hypothetical protein